MIADGATLFTEVALKSISWVDCMKLIEKWLLQMRNLYSVSVLYSISHTALIKLFFVKTISISESLWKLLLPRNGKN
jgi:hypothetical protein